MRVVACQINPIVGDLEGNGEKILRAIASCRSAKGDILLFPELVLSGYPPADLLLDGAFIAACEKKGAALAAETEGLLVVFGLPRKNQEGEKGLFNSAAICMDGRLVGFYDKRLLPTYDVFDERRYFDPGGKARVWEWLGHRIGISICEDAWGHSCGYTAYETDPMEALKKERIDLLLNLSASPYCMGRTRERIAIFEKAAKTVAAPLVMANQVGAQDGLIFDGHSFHINEKGELLQIAKGFEEDLLSVDLHVHVCPIPLPEKEVEELHGALVLGLRDYFHKQGFEKAILGLSGGIDSAVVAALAVRALGAENVRAVAMPSRFSSPESFLDAAALARRLNISIETIDIEPLFFAFLQTLEPLFGNKKWDQTEENLQARIRGTLLMALSNQSGALLLNTSNKSELALGYSTLYGDLNGAIGPLVDVRKGLVYKLASFINREEELIPRSILEKEPTAELREGQKDTDTLPSYAVLDQVIELYIEKRRPKQEIAEALGVSFSFVEDVVKKIHRAEFKRRQAPLGLRVTEKSFSTGRVVPIVQKWT